ELGRICSLGYGCSVITGSNHFHDGIRFRETSSSKRRTLLGIMRSTMLVASQAVALSKSTHYSTTSATVFGAVRVRSPASARGRTEILRSLRGTGLPHLFR